MQMKQKNPALETAGFLIFNCYLVNPLNNKILFAEILPEKIVTELGVEREEVDFIAQTGFVSLRDIIVFSIPIRPFPGHS